MEASGVRRPRPCTRLQQAPEGEDRQTDTRAHTHTHDMII